jgi:photosystem II stability/assembly factor-like uncharacterized protein
MTRRPLSLLLLLLTACGTTAPEPPRGKKERFDQPDQAAAYRAMKQAGSEDPFRSLADAREAMRRLSRYSTTDDALLSPGSRTRVHGDAEAPSTIGQWRFLGPGNIGGRTRVLVIDPAQPEVMYTGGVSGGIWKTYTSGLQWEPIGDDLANIAVNSLVMHPTDRNTLYAGTGEGYFREEVRGTALPLRGDGIFVTHDAGETWTRLASTVSSDFHFVNDLVVSTNDPSRLYAATRTGVWRSLDGGANWTRTLQPNVNGGCLDLAWRKGTSGDYLFASCGTFERATVWRAKNAESNAPWESVLSEPDMGRTSLAIAPSDPSVIYAIAATNEPGVKNQGVLGVFRSTANGDAGSWQARSTSASGHVASQLLSNLIAGSGTECTGQPNEFVTMGWYCNTIEVDPVDANRVWVGGVDLFRSDDGGQTWGVASYWWATSNGLYPSFVHADQHRIVFDPRYDGSSNRRAYFTNDGGIYRTDDTLAETGTGPEGPCDPRSSKFRFVALNNNYGVTQFYHGAVSPDGTEFIAGAQDNGTLMGRLVDGPNAWRGVVGGDGGYVAWDPVEPKVIYATTQWGGMRRSPNGGISFPAIRNGIQGQEFLFIQPYTIDPNFTPRVWLGGRFMFVTNNRGGEWKRASTSLPGLVSAVAVQPGNSERVLAGLATGQIARVDNATTATTATEWTLVQPRAGFVSSLAFDTKDTKVVYATYAGFGGPHVWRSTDAGTTWTSLDGNLPDLPVHSIAVDPTRTGRLYLGTDLGVFVTLDGGQTWNVENTGFANAVTEAVVIAQGASGPAIYAFTHGRGAWRAELVLNGPKRRSMRR